MQRSVAHWEDEFLEAGEVAAHLFRFDGRNGSIIDELPVTSRDGVPEDEFVKIAGEIYDESAALDETLANT